MKTGLAIMRLTTMGYRFSLHGDKIRYEYRGKDAPDISLVGPLLEIVRTHKVEVIAHLTKISPGERILTCADCGFHQYRGPNPRQGYGHCTFKNQGCYGLRQACDDIKTDWDTG